MHELNETDGGISLIALDPGGRFGASATVNTFPFSIGREGE